MWTCPALEGYLQNTMKARNRQNISDGMLHLVRPLARAHMSRQLLLRIWMESGGVFRVVVGGGQKGYQYLSAERLCMG